MIHNRYPSQFIGNEAWAGGRAAVAYADRLPVESVSWDETQTFTWLMNVFGRRHYRLPSEAEWEYAARAGTTTARYWGERAEDGCAYENMADQTWKKVRPDWFVVNCDDGQALTAPVGSYKPNPWGLYDILGNVAEWVEDCYVGDYTKEAPKDGSAFTAEDCTQRVVRGGAWYFGPQYLRAASRLVYSPGFRDSFVGFRLGRDVAP
jgi:formylglycine-generating enzyme required for sulfatase activity